MCFLFAVLSLLIAPIFADEHRGNGTSWENSSISVYAQTRHGPDGALFLDPYFLPYLTDLEGKNLLDAGCGAGPWAIFAAERGATVYGIDIQEAMIEKSIASAKEANVEINWVVGDVGKLPYPDQFFDRAISINVGCNLTDLYPHFKELKRVLKKGALAIIAAPNSFGTVFTNGKNENIIVQIQKLQEEGFPQSVKGLDEVYRATFANREGKWQLILDENELKPGEAIFRKIPKTIVPNYYHGSKEYLEMAKKEGFKIKEVYTPHFKSQGEWQSFNEKNAQTLGKEYIEFSPFVIFVIEK